MAGSRDWRALRRVASPVCCFPCKLSVRLSHVSVINLVQVIWKDWHCQKKIFFVYFAFNKMQKSNIFHYSLSSFFPHPSVSYYKAHRQKIYNNRVPRAMKSIIFKHSESLILKVIIFIILLFLFYQLAFWHKNFTMEED